jgi:penicillin-binding protein 1C
MNDGTLLPRQLLADVPTSFQDFQPANFYQDYDGAVPADEALARSLNIPFVYLLQDYGVPRLHAALRNYGFDQLTQAPAHYGLSLILGGGEITMEEINAWFTGLARQQRYFYERQGQYQAADFHRPTLLDDQYRPATTDLSRTPGAINAGAGWLMLQALRELNRRNGGHPPLYLPPAHRLEDGNELRLPRRLGRRLHPRLRRQRLGR